MPENLAKVVTKESLTKALEEIIATSPSLIPSTKYDIVYKGKRFPPKEVIRKAAQIQGIQDWQSYRLSGGESSSRHLRAKGFDIQPKLSTIKYYIGGAKWDEDDYTKEFIEDGYWENGYDDRYTDKIKSVPVGSFIAIKSTYARGKDSRLRIKCIGVVTKNVGDGKVLEVNWEKPFKFFDISGLGSYRGTFYEITDKDDIDAMFNHEEDDSNASDVNDVKLVKPLNKILYGPPGTGKTYNTVKQAVEIIRYPQIFDGDKYEDAKQIFNELQGDQIEFITFHQNYSYEDFVQGLRPNIENDNSPLSFKKHEGIFKLIADRALKNWEESQTSNVTVEPSFEEVFEDFFKPLIEETGTVKVPMESKGYSFELTRYNEEANNINYIKQSKGTGHNIYIPTLRLYYREPEVDHTQGLQYYYRPLAKAMRARAEQMKKTISGKERKNYVLVIDEINRANISRVFGELITLLEDDKRWGGRNQLKVKLPSGDMFTVPDNLFIIGTMNTADKSIALLDIALRRRFVFEDMYPRPELIDNLVPSPYNIFLKELNTQILNLKGADFLIGHAYFIPDEGTALSFQMVMNQKIIPLLNEYFYNQRNNSVLSLLQKAIQLVPGYGVVKDDYLGVTCINSA